MAVLGRVNWASQQRIDLSHVLAEQSFAAYDFRAAMRMFNGLNRNFVVRGLEVSGVSGLSMTVNVANSVILMPLDGTAAFFVADGDAESEIIVLPPSVNAIYVEAYLERESQTPVTTAFFDPGLTSETNPAGSEFTAPTDFQQVVTLKFRFKTDGFTPDAIAVAVIQTSATQVTSVTDSRYMFFRLGTGGAAPDSFHRFPWSDLREETANPGPASAIGQFSSNNPYYVQDANGAKNDKAFTNLKEWMDAVMTVIAEMKGTPTWYYPTVGKTITNLLFLSPNATSFVPTLNRTLQWSANSDGILRSKGASNALPVTYGMNYGPVRWYIGKSFVAPGVRRFADKNWELPLSPQQNFFLYLQRDILPPGTISSSVKWGTESIATSTDLIPLAKQIKGLSGDFTGVAIGDYVRKASAEYYQYYRVVGIVESDILIEWDPLTESLDDTPWGQVATNSCTGLILEKEIDVALVEPYLWFKTAYSEEEFYTTQIINTFNVQSNTPVPLVLPVDDINLYWLGRAGDSIGSEIQYRDYGNMSPGEEISFLNDSVSSFQQLGSDMFVRLDRGVAIDSSGTVSGLNSTYFTIQKRRTDNITPSGVDNINGWQTYTIGTPQPLVFANDGDGLWARFDDYQSGIASLSAGVVDPGDPIVPLDNVFEIIPATRNPLKNTYNKNVTLICRRVTVNGVVGLQFLDGSILQLDGKSIERDISKVISGVVTNVGTTTAVNHGYQRNITDFLWTARRQATGVVVNIGATQTATGITLDATPGGAETLTITFTRHLA